MERRVKRRSFKVSLLVLASLISANLGALATNVDNFVELKDSIKGTSGTIDFTNNIVAAEVLTVTNDFIINGYDKNIITNGDYHRAFLVQDGANVTINNLIFNDFLINEKAKEVEKGAALLLSNGTLNINNSRFVHNIAANQESGTGDITMGGAVYVKDGQLTITNSYFGGDPLVHSENPLDFGNTARRGGAVATQDRSLVQAAISNSVFEYNFARFGGGALSNGGEMTIADSTFNDNFVHFYADANLGENGGGAVSNTGSLTFTGTNVFSDNTAERSGGAVINKATANATIRFLDNVRFIRNKNTYEFPSNSLLQYGGGALYNNQIVYFGNITDTSSTSALFESNRTTASGGALFNKGTMNIYMPSVFGGVTSNLGNYAAGYGGAIFNIGSLRLNSLYGQNQFLYNKAENDGGAIYNSTAGRLWLSGSHLFEKNSSVTGKGGAIYNTGTFVISGDSQFIGNTAAQSGGAIYSYIADSSTGSSNLKGFTLSGNATFTGNKALGKTSGEGGGAVVVEGGTFTIEGNRTGDILGVKDSIGLLSSLVTTDSNGYHYLGDSVKAKILFNDNSIGTSGGGFGGAIKVAGTASGATGRLILSGVDFLYNWAGSHAGAIRGEGNNNRPSHIYINDTVFIGNSAINYGGAISSGGESDIYISDSYFEGNYLRSSSSSESYGGVLSNGHILKILNSEFYNNSAQKRAGAINFNGTLLGLIADGADTIFSGNTAAGESDAIVIDTSNNKYYGKAEGVHVQFNAGNGGRLIMDDKFRTIGSRQTVDLNADVGDYIALRRDSNGELGRYTAHTPQGGEIILNNTAGNVNLVLHTGTLSIGQDTSKLSAGDSYFDDSTMVIKNGVLNLANGNIESGDTLKLNSLTIDDGADAKLRMDVFLGSEDASATPKIDFINTKITGNGKITIDDLRFTGKIYSDLGAVGSTINLQFANGNDVVNTTLLPSLRTIITSDAGYSLGLGTTTSGKDTLKIVKSISAGGLPVAVSIGDIEEFSQSTYVYSATTDENINSWTKEYSILDDDGNLQTKYTGNVLKGDKLVINGNDKNVISTGSNLEGIKLTKDQELDINDVKGWKNFSSAVINEGGTVNVTNTTFKDNVNTATNGGAIRNLNKDIDNDGVADVVGVVNLKNVVFKDNKGVQGGAIYNEGTINISSENLVDVLFDGNKNGSNASEAIYNNGGTVNMAADATSKITFNGKVTADSTNRGEINIGYTAHQNLGTVTFNESVSNFDLTLNNGTLQLGQTATAARDDYFQNVNLTLNGGTIVTATDGTETLVNAGTLSLENGYLDTLNVGNLELNDITNLVLDLDIGNVASDFSVQSDKLTASSVSGTNGKINIDRINLIGTLPDTENSVIATFINQDVDSTISEAMKSVTLDGKVYSISTEGNQITISKQGESGGYAYTVAIDPTSERTFQISDTDVTTRPWIDGKNQLAGGGLHVIGVGGGSLIGNGQEGIKMGYNEEGFPQELQFVNVANYKNFQTAVINDGGTVSISGSTFSENLNGENGGVIRNLSGEVYVYGGTVFENNSVVNNGGAIYNNSTLEMNPVAGKNITFTGNTAGVDAEGSPIYNDIYQTAKGVTNITGANGGNITIDGGIAGLGSINKIGYGSLILNGDNSNYKGSFTQEGVDNNTTYGGDVTVNPGAKFFAGNTVINNSTLNWYTAEDIPTDGTLTVVDGTVNIGSSTATNAVLSLNSGSSIDANSKVCINGGSAILNNNDAWKGLIQNNGGTFKTIGVVNSTSQTGDLQQASGTASFTDNSIISINNANSYITGGNVEIMNNSQVSMAAGIAPMTVDNLTMANNSYLNVMNNEISTSNIGNFTVNNKNNVAIDISPSTHTYDSFNINNIVTTDNGTINIADFNFVGKAPTTRNIKLQVFNANNISPNIEFTATNKKIHTPIGNYQLSSLGGGAFNAGLTSFNPQVFRGQAATLAAYNNQIMIGDMLTNHFILPQDREIDTLAKKHNIYASASTLFSPYLNNSLEEGGLWTKNYVSFETMSLNNHLNVGNNAYGTVIGADFPLVQLKHGWKFIPTAYISYNGGNQHFNGVKMYQNGTQGGFMGTFHKNDFIGSIVAYGGGYFNDMHINDAIDRTGNWFAGTMAKVAYNLHPTEHFTIQPTALVSYNAFGKQNWGSDFGDMSMNSGMLNGINTAPGVNLIYSRDTWSIYGTLQYMFNINDSISGKAGDIQLADVHNRYGFVQYGVGMTKTWKDRLSSYFQVCLRNGGRTGIGLQAGLKIFLGKDPKNSPPKTSKNLS